MGLHHGCTKKGIAGLHLRLHTEEEENNWELSLRHLQRMEVRGITPIGVYLGGSAENLVQLRQLFSRLVHTSENVLPDRLGDLPHRLVE
jgi:hypothetical protein